MESRSPYRWNSIVEEDKEVDTLSQVEPEPPAGVWLRSNFPDIVNVIGSASGKKYTFNGGGSEAMVDADDVSGFLKKTFGGTSCCGNGKPSPMFTVISK